MSEEGFQGSVIGSRWSVVSGACKHPRGDRRSLFGLTDYRPLTTDYRSVRPAVEEEETDRLLQIAAGPTVEECPLAPEARLGDAA